MKIKGMLYKNFWAFLFLLNYFYQITAFTTSTRQFVIALKKHKWISSKCSLCFTQIQKNYILEKKALINGKANEISTLTFTFSIRSSGAWHFIVANEREKKKLFMPLHTFRWKPTWQRFSPFSSQSRSFSA